MYHFFISDKNNIARRQNVQREAAKLGITPNFFDAIMGRNLSQEELANLVVPDTFSYFRGNWLCSKSFSGDATVFANGSGVCLYF